MLKLTITIEGATDTDVEVALEEVLRLVAVGNLHGHNRNESGAFLFTTEDVESSELVPERDAEGHPMTDAEYAQAQAEGRAA